jgi:hypothetical protein
MWRLLSVLLVSIFIVACGPAGGGVPGDEPMTTPYPITVPLDTAQTDQRFHTPGMKYLYADLGSTGQAIIKFGSTSGQGLTLIPGSNYPIEADDIFLTYSAQPGNKLELLHSSEPIGGGGNRQTLDTPLIGTLVADTSNINGVVTTFFTEAENTNGVKILNGLILAISSGGYVMAILTADRFSPAASFPIGIISSNAAVGIIETASTELDKFFIPPGFSLTISYTVNPSAAGSSAGVRLNYEKL